MIGLVSHGMDIPDCRRLPRNRIRLCDEVFRRIHTPDPFAGHGGFRADERGPVLSISLRTLPMGTGYAVWTGIGAAGTAILGILVLGDSAAPQRVLCIGLILAGVVGLKLISGD